MKEIRMILTNTYVTLYLNDDSNCHRHSQYEETHVFKMIMQESQNAFSFFPWCGGFICIKPSRDVITCEIFVPAKSDGGLKLLYFLSKWRQGLVGGFFLDLLLA